MQTQEPRTLLCVEDDPDDRFLIREACQEAGLDVPIDFLCHGDELLDYLHRRGDHAGRVGPAPGMILLDLNMPIKDGRETLKELKAHPQFRLIPVIVLTTSMAEADIRLSYELGANAFVVKPSKFDEMVRMVRTLCDHWLRTVTLPAIATGHAHGD